MMESTPVSERAIMCSLSEVLVPVRVSKQAGIQVSLGVSVGAERFEIECSSYPKKRFSRIVTTGCT